MNTLVGYLPEAETEAMRTLMAPMEADLTDDPDQLDALSDLLMTVIESYVIDREVAAYSQGA